MARWAKPDTVSLEEKRKKKLESKGERAGPAGVSVLIWLYRELEMCLCCDLCKAAAVVSTWCLHLFRPSAAQIR
jgi:hypothetical protein